MNLLIGADGAALEIGQLLDAWDAFFFTPEPATVSGLVRIALGLVLVADALLVLREAPFTLGPAGLVDDATYRESPAGQRLSLYRVLPPSETANRWFVRFHLLVCLFFLVGFLTPLSAAVCVVTLTSIHHRSPLVVNSGDVLLRLLMMCAVFLPGGYWGAVDVWLFDRDPDALVVPWALRLIQIQIAVVYLRTAFWKLRGEFWRDGSAVYRVLTLTRLTRRTLPGPLHRAWVYRTLTWGTLVFEIGFPLLIWVDELRWPLLAVAVAFHLGLDAFLRIRLFQWVMLAGLVAFIPPF